jgi:hypothetical protein
MPGNTSNNSGISSSQFQCRRLLSRGISCSTMPPIILLRGRRIRSPELPLGYSISVGADDPTTALMAFAKESHAE